VLTHLHAGRQFNWKNVDVRAAAYEGAIVHRDFTEALCVEQKKQHFKIEREFERYWKRLRPKLDQILLHDPSKRPASFHEAVAIAIRDGGVLWGIGQRLYDYFVLPAMDWSWPGTTGRSVL
jgi:hypothetical protein